MFTFITNSRDPTLIRHSYGITLPSSHTHHRVSILNGLIMSYLGGPVTVNYERWIKFTSGSVNSKSIKFTHRIRTVGMIGISGYQTGKGAIVALRHTYVPCNASPIGILERTF